LGGKREKVRKKKKNKPEEKAARLEQRSRKSAKGKGFNNIKLLF
jgi:hypothetical protein